MLRIVLIVALGCAAVPVAAQEPPFDRPGPFPPQGDQCQTEWGGICRVDPRALGLDDPGAQYLVRREMLPGIADMARNGRLTEQEMSAYLRGMSDGLRYDFCMLCRCCIGAEVAPWAEPGGGSWLDKL